MQTCPPFSVTALVACTLAASAADPAHAALRLTGGEMEYGQVHWQVGANIAHDAGFTGKGAVVAVLDTGVQGNHAELRKQLSPRKMYDATTGRTVSATDGNGHGTHVAGIIAGSTNTGFSYGIAPQAKIMPVKIFDSDTWTIGDGALAAGLDKATANRAVSVINLSIEFHEPLTWFAENAMRSAVNAGKLLVVAAGNNGSSAPEWPARYARESWANGQIIAVGAVDADNHIADFSNRAGDTASWFIVAPGVDLVSSYNDGGYSYMSGTSMAAPVVSGAAALLKGAWPQLRAGQIADILFRTATDLGAPGVDAVYGWGLLNVARAVEPVGILAVPLRNAAPAASTAGMQTSVASWSGLRAAARAGQFRGIVVDDFNRDYRTDFAAGLRAPTAERVSDALARAERPLRLSASRLADGSQYLAAVEEALPEGLRGDAQPTRKLIAASAVFKLSGGKELALATGSLAGSYFGLAADDAALASPYLGLARSAAQMAFGYTRGDFSLKAGVLDNSLNAAMARQHEGARVGGGRAAIGEVNYAAGRDVTAGLQFATVTERDSWLGSVAGDALALQGGGTDTVTAHASWHLGKDTLLAARYSVGWTQDTHGNGLLSAVHDIRSEAFALGLVGRSAVRNDDRLAVTLSSPMRITGGRAQIAMPVAITEAGETVFESRSIALGGTRRELKLALDYTTPLSATTNLSWLAAWRHNANHVAGEREIQAGAVYRIAF